MLKDFLSLIRTIISVIFYIVGFIFMTIALNIGGKELRKRAFNSLCGEK